MSGQERNRAKPTHLPQIVSNTSKLSSTNSEACERYRIGRFLGSGGFAFCYVATELNSKKQYAIKVVNKTSENMTKNGAKDRLKNQIDIMKKLNHDNILKLISNFEDDHNHYLVLEICNKLSLSELLKRKSRMIELEVKYFIRQLAMAVLYLKQMHVLHRDIKTPNILLDDNMNVKLADFGLAISSDVTNVRSYGCCGTPSYMAPEVIREDRQAYRRYSFEVDMWSIGVVTFVLLFSNHPFFCSEYKAGNQRNHHNYQKIQQKKTYQNIKNVRYSFPLITKNSISSAAKDFIKKIFVVNPQARLSIEEALSHQFLTQTIPAKMPAELYGKQLRNSDLLVFCKTEKPPVFKHSKQKQVKINRTITSYLSNMSIENLEKKMFRTAKKTKSTPKTSEELNQSQKESKEKVQQKNPEPFSIKMSRVLPALPEVINPSSKKQTESQKSSQIKSPLHIYQEQSQNQCEANPQIKEANNFKGWLDQKLNDQPYIYEFRDLSQKFGICYHLSNGVKVILFNDKSTMSINQANKSVVYIEPVSKKLQECQRLLYKLVVNSGIDNGGVPRLALSRCSVPSLHNQKIDQDDKYGVSKDYKIIEFRAYEPPDNIKIIKKYFFLKQYCRTFTTNTVTSQNIDLIKCATMIRRWGCKRKSQQYIFFTKNFTQVMFVDGANYFLNKENSNLILFNQYEGVTKEITLPLRNKKVLTKRQNVQIETIGKFMRYFVNFRKQNENKSDVKK